MLNDSYGEYKNNRKEVKESDVNTTTNPNKTLQESELTKNIEKDEEMEDVTKYGEFVSSYFAWLTPERQKKRAKEIDEMTKQ